MRRDERSRTGVMQNIVLSLRVVHVRAAVRCEVSHVRRLFSSEGISTQYATTREISRRCAPVRAPRSPRSTPPARARRCAVARARRSGRARWRPPPERCAPRVSSSPSRPAPRVHPSRPPAKVSSKGVVITRRHPQVLTRRLAPSPPPAPTGRLGRPRRARAAVQRPARLDAPRRAPRRRGRPGRFIRRRGDDALGPRAVVPGARPDARGPLRRLQRARRDPRGATHVRKTPAPEPRRRAHRRLLRVARGGRPRARRGEAALLPLPATRRRTRRRQ